MQYNLFQKNDQRFKNKPSCLMISSKIHDTVLFINKKRIFMLKTIASLSAKVIFLLYYKRISKQTWRITMKKPVILVFLFYILSTQSIYSSQNNIHLIHALNDGNLKFAKELLEKGADVKIIHEFGSTPLTNAVIKKDRDLIKFLLDHGADLFSVNNEGNIPWLMALEENDEDFIEFLRTYQPRKRDAILLGAAVHNYASNFESR